MKNTILCLSLFVGFGSTFAQIVNIPDANFKAYLVGNTAINTNMDTEIQVSEATAFTGTINCPNLNISDLTGIEAFTNLSTLACNNNQLNSLNVSANTALVTLYCHNNFISSLDVSSNLFLSVLQCNNTQLTALDVSNNAALTNLICFSTLLNSLDLSSNAVLSNLTCYNCQLTDLNLGNNANLIGLYCNNNYITNLDVTSCVALNELNCYSNQLTTLDLSSNVNLVFFQGYNNLLTSLNIANGNNANMAYFSATGNSDLECIEVDDATWSTTNWTNIDATASFSEDCSGGLGVDDLNNNASLHVYPNPVQNILTIQTNETIKRVHVFNSLGKLVLTEENKSFSVDQLESGVYFIQLETAQGYFNSMFIKD